MCGVGPEDPDQLTESGHELLERYELDGDAENLRWARAAYERALLLAGPSADRSVYLNNLGGCLRLVYEESRDLADLAEAMAVLEAAVNQRKPGSAERAMPLDNLGLALRDLYAATGDVAHLRRAARLHEEAVTTAAEGPDRTLYVNNLGGARWELYKYAGDRADLEEAVALFDQAVRATPADSTDLPMRLANLAASLRDSFLETGDMAVLDRALTAVRDAVGSSPAGAADRPRQAQLPRRHPLRAIQAHQQRDRSQRIGRCAPAGCRADAARKRPERGLDAQPRPGPARPLRTHR